MWYRPTTLIIRPPPPNFFFFIIIIKKIKKCDVFLIDVVRLLYARALLLHSELLEVCPLRIEGNLKVELQ